MSALPDLTRAGDPIASFGGTSPSGEGVTNAIDNTTSKFLQNVRQVMFDNSRPFTSYRVSVSGIKTTLAALVQVGEVEILGAPVFGILLEAGPSPGTVTLHSQVPGHLCSVSLLEGTNTAWVNEGKISNAITIPVDSSAPSKFYRVLLP